MLDPKMEPIKFVQELAARGSESYKEIVSERDNLERELEHVSDTFNKVVSERDKLEKELAEAKRRLSLSKEDIAALLWKAEERNSLAAQLEEMTRNRDSLKFELQALEHVRLKDNQYLIDQRDKVQSHNEEMKRVLNNLFILIEMGDHIDKSWLLGQISQTMLIAYETRSQLERLKDLFSSFGIDYQEEEDEKEIRITIEKGKGYTGFCASFHFNVRGKFDHYAVWE